MALQILNLSDLEREFRNRAAHLYNPDAQAWLTTIPKDYLLDTDGKLAETDKQENFARYHRKWKRLPMDGVPEVLPDWVEEALKRREAVYVYDPVQPTRRAFWSRKIRHIVNWFNSKPPPEIDWKTLSFETALHRVDTWYQEKGLS